MYLASQKLNTTDLLLVFFGRVRSRNNKQSSTTHDLSTMALQPDFGAISGGFELLLQQFSRCANLPAVDQGARLVQALEAINNQIMALRQDVTALRQDVRRIEQKLDTR